MKRFFFTTFATLCVLLAMAQSRVVLSSGDYDFGEIEETGGDVSCEFILKNISAQPLVVSHMRSDCSCVTTRYSRKPIVPQGVDTLRITFDPRFRAGVLNKKVYVYLSGDSLPTTLTIRGTVIGRSTKR
ncbi:MAG: DUF1573 domain-containing protein [Rikenellaceae bacterium]